MVKRLWRSTLIILAVLVAILVIAQPAYATILPPDSTPTAEFYVYHNLLETGDWLILAYHNIPYGTPPATTPIWQAFMWRFMAADNVTEIATALPTAFNDNGYGYNLSSFYLSASNVTSAGLAWNTAYPIKLSGNPVAFTTPPEYNFALSMANYSTFTATADVKAELAARILLIASDLDVRWALGATYSLLNETETGTVLSIYGEAFFRGAIYGLQGLCPQLFAYVISDLDLVPRTWTSTYVTTLETQYTGTWVNTAKAAGAALFGTTYDLTGILISLLVVAALLICTVVLSGDAWHGMADGRTGLIAMTRLGFFGLGFLALLGALAVIYGATRLWGVMK